MPARTLPLAAVIGIATAATAALGGLASSQAGSFYAALQRPSWAPPSWLFGPVWTGLYLLMAVAVILAWRAGARRWRDPLLGFYFFHLLLNGLWSWLFFAWQAGLWSVIDILALLLAIIVLGVWCWRRQVLAGILLVPYLIWVAFAAALNVWLWQANPAALGAGF